MQTNVGQHTALPTPQTSVPANAPARRVTEATRVPMSLPNPKLSVPDVPGFFLYWHLGKNVRAALKAGYTYVDEEELEVEQRGIANDASTSGSTDMGTRISIAAGGTVSDDNLEPERLYLMKLPQEWRDQDQAAQGKISENIAIALRSGKVGAEGEAAGDTAHRYLKAGQDLFYPAHMKKRKST